jgi:hypothetical protein
MKFMMFKTTVALTAALLCSNLCQAQPAGNIVQNWNFSSPNGEVIPDWTYSGYLWSAFNGVNGGSYVGINTYFSQTLATQPGQKYLLQFYTTAAVPGIGQSGPLGLSVTWDSQNAIDYTLTQATYNWIPEDLQVTASGTQTTLEFDRIYGALPYLDNVSLVPVPEADCATFIVLGLSFLGVWRISSAFARGRCGRIP